ncbi:hypothetical protein [Legionella sp. W05-934-2]|jgi:hypothetical protein|uniref:hypothetical protein n=1 Tax=Legionella sp. W05-934-2 TaxID=1198649 RepID=UPI0034634D70
MAVHETKAASPFQLLVSDDGSSSILISHRQHRYLFDCWLSPQYVALHPAFYSGKRTTPAWLNLSCLPALDGLLLSSRQNDHSDPKTLQAIYQKNPLLPIWAPASLAYKLRHIGFEVIYTSRVGQLFLINQHLRALQLSGYGGCTPFLLQDIPSKHTLCIAPHSIDLPWLKANHVWICQQFELSLDCPSITTLCIGITPTLLAPFGRLSWIMPQKGINIPLPQDTLSILQLLNPKKIIPIHHTPELRSGWAAKHLVKFPHAPQSPPNHSFIDIGTKSVLQWLVSRYQKGDFISPKNEPISC